MQGWQPAGCQAGISISSVFLTMPLSPSISSYPCEECRLLYFLTNLLATALSCSNCCVSSYSSVPACKVGGLPAGAPTSSSIYGLEPPLLIVASFPSLLLTPASWQGKTTSVKHEGDLLIRRSCLWQCLWDFGMKPGRSACWDCPAGLQRGRSK